MSNARPPSVQSRSSSRNPLKAPARRTRRRAGNPSAGKCVSKEKETHVSLIEHRADIDAAQAKQFAERIKAAWQKCTADIIAVGKLLIEAKEALGYGCFEAMIKDKLPFGPRTAERLMEIANNPILSNPTHVSHLPASWGTLHALAQIPNETLIAKIEDGSINPDLQRKDVAALKLIDETKPVNPPPGAGLPGPKTANKIARVEAKAAPVAHVPAAPTKRKRPSSRSQRWADAAGEALAALNDITTALDAFETAVGELRSVQEEYEEWKDNLPENLASSALGEKLEEVCGLNIESAADTVRNAVKEVQSTFEEAESIELPQGFGRD
jgi:hypothetical protein